MGRLRGNLTEKMMERAKAKLMAFVLEFLMDN